MKGEGFCGKAPEHSYHGPFHCIHDRVRKRDAICCWCGDLFLGEEPAPEPQALESIRARKCHCSSYLGPCGCGDSARQTAEDALEAHKDPPLK